MPTSLPQYRQGTLDTFALRPVVRHLVQRHDLAERSVAEPASDRWREWAVQAARVKVGGHDQPALVRVPPVDDRLQLLQRKLGVPLLPQLVQDEPFQPAYVVQPDREGLPFLRRQMVKAPLCLPQPANQLLGPPHLARLP